MKFIKTILFVSIVFCFVSSSILAEEYKLNPTKDEKSLTGLYIPKDIEDCFVELDKMLPDKLIAEIKSGSEDDMIKYHRSLGRGIRNNWGIWGKSRLARYFLDLGARHPDDISGMILDSYYRYLNGKSIKLDEQLKSYQEYWDNLKDE